MSFELFDRVSIGDLTVFNQISPADDLHLPLLYAIPETVRLEEITKHVTEFDSVWLLNRGLQVEEVAGDVEEAIRLFSASQHPLKDKLIRDFQVYQCVVDYMADKKKKVSFKKLQDEVERLPHNDQVKLCLCLSEKGLVYLPLLESAFGDDDEDGEGGELDSHEGDLMEEIFG
jgi:hypothetical protein